MRLLEAFRNIFAVPDLRKRVLFTFGLLAVYRIGSHIPTPGLDAKAFEEFFRSNAGGLLGFLDIFSGGALRRLSVFALGITPYITASIILQLLTVVWPYLEKLSKEGELGRRKITQYTRYGTVLLSLIQGSGIALWLWSTTAPSGARLVHGDLGKAAFVAMAILTLTTGTAFVMWLGEQITERGIGNGISAIIFAGIVATFPTAVWQSVQQIIRGQQSLIVMAILTIFMLGVIAAIVFVERAQRRIPVQYAKRVVGRRIYGGQNTYLPLRVNTGGVIPIIFAVSIIQFPQYMASAFESDFMKRIAEQLAVGQPLYNLMYMAGIIFFCYFYISIIFNPNDTAENMRKYGGFIPGIRPGKATSEYIDSVLTRITLIGAIYLVVVALIPEFLLMGFKVQGIPFIGAWLDTHLPAFITQGLGVTFYFGGTSTLIVVGVAMDTIQQVESQLVMRNYEGFLKKGRIRGRRG
ncbi:MAG: preprotein translocase subunit SecY [Acidobacteria bacterium]|nr:preprotein translocase subunit SecY [Acidobacteriota bacterium]MCG3192488.1 Protein translocase subunit SecY [Thermoanaerobaculia bacterium]MCK6683321.1 preprotein translocase subunit SecY [Thermoanaerobaculia bacterium]